MITILVITALVILSCTLFGKPRQYTSFYTNQTVTVWKDYVVFGKYEGQMAPKDNYVNFKKKDGYYIRVFFKNNNTVTIWSKLNEPIRTGFDTNKYDIKIYYGQDNLRQFYDECRFSDSLAVMEYALTKNPLWGFEIKMYEITTDTVYISRYNIGLFGSISRKVWCVYPRDYDWFER